VSKSVRFMDFQVGVGSTSLALNEQRLANLALFSTYEPVRLWLKEREIKAPFRKCVITLSDEGTFTRWHGNVSNVAGICEVTEAINVTTLVQMAGDHRWVLGIVEHALACVARSTGWQSEELESFIKMVSERPFPLVHFFAGLTQVDKVSGVKCVPWFSSKPGETQIGVRVGERDLTVVSKPGPLFLEDDFPLAKSAIRGREFLLLDKSGNALASVSIEALAPH